MVDCFFCLHLGMFNKIKEEKMRKFSSSGMIWDDGDMPSCTYCKKTYDEVYCLHETPFSGELCCDNEQCRNALLESVLIDEVLEVTEPSERDYYWEQKAENFIKTGGYYG